MSWVFYAVMSAVFAALTTIFAKIGLQGINSNLATAIRTVVVLFMAWLVVFATGAGKGIATITKSNMIFLVLSGLATGCSWLFYFKAIQMGDVSKVVPIDKLSMVLVVIFAVMFLNEPLTWQVVTATLLISAGTFILII